MAIENLILYSRKKCPLCDKAKDKLQELQDELEFTFIEIDIHTDDDLIENYGLMIPVIVRQGEVIQYGNIDKAHLRLQLTETTGNR